VLSVVYRIVSVSAEKRSRNKGIMSERQNTVVCSFDPKSIRISALDFHECNDYGTVRRTPRQVYVNFAFSHYLQDLLHSTKASPNTNTTKGKYRKWRYKLLKWARGVLKLAYLPPELPDDAVSFAFSQHGEIRKCKERFCIRPIVIRFSTASES